jgi:hypothetical protein
MLTRPSVLSAAAANRSAPARRHTAASPVAALTLVVTLTLAALVPLAGAAPLLRFAAQAALVLAVLPAAWLLLKVITTTVTRAGTSPDAWTTRAPATHLDDAA